MKRTTGTVAVLSAAVLVLTACADSDDNSNNNGDDGGADTTEDAGEDGGEETEAAGSDTDSDEDEATDAPAEGDAEEDEEPPVPDAGADLVIWADNERAPILEEYAQQFGDELGVTVQVQVATDVREQFRNATSVNQGPDVIVGAHDWLGEMVQNGHVAPVQLSADVQDQFTPESIEATQFDGQIYGVPYATENLGLIRNVNLAPDAPATMEELVETGQQLIEDGEAEYIMGLPVGLEGDAYHAYPILSAAGGGIFGVNDEGGWDPENLTIDSPETIAGGEHLAWLAEEGALSVNIDYPTMQALFVEERAPFMITGPWEIPSVQGAGIDYEITPIPNFENGDDPQTFVGVQMFYVSSQAQNDSIAQEFVAGWATREEVQLDLFEAGQRPPALISALEQVSADDEDIAAWAEAGEGAQPMPNIPAMNAVWEPLGQAVSDIVGGDDPTERLEAAQQEIEAGLG